MEGDYYSFHFLLGDGRSQIPQKDGGGLVQATRFDNDLLGLFFLFRRLFVTFILMQKTNEQLNYQKIYKNTSSKVLSFLSSSPSDSLPFFSGASFGFSSSMDVSLILSSARNNIIVGATKINDNTLTFNG